MGKHLTFIVGRASGVEIAVAFGRLERIGIPRFERFGGLNVVMAVDQQRRLTGDSRGFRVNERMLFGLDQLGGQAGVFHEVADEFGRASRVFVAIGLGADARNPQERLEPLLEVGSMGFQIRVHRFDRHVFFPFRACFNRMTWPSLNFDHNAAGERRHSLPSVRRDGKAGTYDNSRMTARAADVLREVRAWTRSTMKIIGRLSIAVLFVLSFIAVLNLVLYINDLYRLSLSHREKATHYHITIILLSDGHFPEDISEDDFLAWRSKLMDWLSQMEVKYSNASRHPWRSLEPDPPKPPYPSHKSKRVGSIQE